MSGGKEGVPSPNPAAASARRPHMLEGQWHQRSVSLFQTSSEMLWPFLK